jgi:hypothetical protein
MEEGRELRSVRALVVWLCFELISGGILWWIGLISPPLMVVLGILGLAAVRCYDSGHRGYIAIPAILACVSVGVALYVKPKAITEPVAQSETADPHGLCFVDFELIHADGKMQIRARMKNRHKVDVMTTLVGYRFSLDDYPQFIAPMEAETKPLYAQQSWARADSNVLTLSKEPAPDAVLPGKVHFVMKYGPTLSNPALLRIKGRVVIHLWPATVDWYPDPDSTPDCPGVERLVNQPL